MRVFACAILLFLLPMGLWAGTSDLLVADVSSQEIQNARADADNLSRMRDLSMLRRFVQHGYLVPVPSSTSSYYLHSIPSSYRYCRPWTRLFLQRLSRQYHARFKQRLRVTSMVRTTVRQRRLARRNGNAADASGAARSSHLTGATIDISKRWMSPEAQQWMRDVLFSLRNQGYLYAIEEFEQPTFHIMVYRSYPDYVKRVARSARASNSKKKEPMQSADVPEESGGGK